MADNPPQGSTKAAEALGPSGAVAAAFPHFVHRTAQQEMAEAVEHAIRSKGTLVCEAGTGTGKTFAYLVPALQAGKRVVVSTGTKHLQDQLFDRDLPQVRSALGTPVRVALLKGRNNYLCLHRLETSRERPLDRTVARQREAVFRWAGRTRIGDIAEVAELPEDAPVWPYVTSTAENCLGGQCDYFEECHVVRGRRRALDADVVVVNHHLFFADLALREEGFGELLPEVDAVIFDEAHLIPQIATQFFGTSISTRQLGMLVDDALGAYGAEAGDTPGFTELCLAVRRASEQVRADFGTGEGRVAWERVRRRRSLAASVENLTRSLNEFAEALGVLRERGTTLASCADRASAAKARLGAILEADDPEKVVWVELYRRSLTWHSSPLEVGPIMRSHMGVGRKAWIFTSATLSVAGSCQHFAERAGLEDYVECSVASPFDYPNQWLGYLPKGLPAPRDESFHQRLSEAILPVLNASRGRAFLLFTSYRGMTACYDALRPWLDFPLLVQGEAPRNDLLNRFRKLGNAVLFGTSSFWQGVDVQGDALSCVVIDKLPFEAPGDPLLSARLDLLRQRGDDPFMAHQVPQAVIALKQGVGRLIRGESDRGVVMLGDPRILQQAYGRVFLESIPPLPITRSIEDVQTFYASEPVVERHGRDEL